MRDWAVLVVWLAGGASALVPGLLAAQGPPPLAVDGEEIVVDAESMVYDQQMDSVSATGGVVLRRGETVLRADELRFNRRTSEAEAIGNVSLTDPEGVISAERAQLKLDEETGELEGVEIYSVTRGYSLRGDRVEKSLGHSYHIENGRFTTCQCVEGPPSWSIAANTFDVTLEGYGVVEGGTFNILDVPVLYLPRMLIPVRRERQSGLLLPRVGLSNQRGFQVLQPLYWAIDKSQDATVGLDIETSARIGLLGEYRYVRSRTFHGTVNLSYFNEFFRGAATESSTGRRANPEVPENRWGLMTEHSQRLGSAEAYADLLLVGDDLFLREINTFTIDHDRDVALRTLPFTTSRVGVIERRNRLMLHAAGIVYQDLIGRDSRALQRVPEVRLSGQKLLGFWSQARLVSSLVNFQRARGTAGFRLDVEPGVQLRLPLGRSVRGAVGATFRETAYQLTDAEMEIACRTNRDCPSGDECGADGFCRSMLTGGPSEAAERLPARQSRETVELRASVQTGASRVFDFPHFGVEKLKHTIEPLAEYRYIPSVNQDELPIFDGLDRVSARNLVTYGVASRLLARTAAPVGSDGARGPVYELARASIMQSYDLDRRIPSVGESGGTDYFSDVDLALRINPTRNTSVHARSSYDASEADITAATVGIRLQEPPAAGERWSQRLVTRHSLAVSYRFITENLLQQLDWSMIMRLTDRIGVLYASRYDLPEKRFLENHVGLRLTSSCDCWSLDLGVTDKSNPNEVEVRAQLSLIGLGSTGSESRFGASD